LYHLQFFQEASPEAFGYTLVLLIRMWNNQTPNPTSVYNFTIQSRKRKSA